MWEGAPEPCHVFECSHTRWKTWARHRISLFCLYFSIKFNTAEQTWTSMASASSAHAVGYRHQLHHRSHFLLKIVCDCNVYMILTKWIKKTLVWMGTKFNCILLKIEGLWPLTTESLIKVQSKLCSACERYHENKCGLQAITPQQ